MKLATLTPGDTIEVNVKGSTNERCEGCGAEIAQPQGSGRRRKWCSDPCRKATLYYGICLDCGGRTSGVANGRDRAPKRCGSCAKAVNMERNELLVEMWEADEPTWYIAEKLGMTEGAVTAHIYHRRRACGEHLPCRRIGGGSAEREERHRRLIELRTEGLTNTEIAEVVGMASAASVSVAFSRLRREGWSVPPAPTGRRAAAA